jgi:hypothetical protein
VAKYILYIVIVSNLFIGNNNAQNKQWQASSKTEVLKDYARMADWIRSTKTCYLQVKYKSFENHNDVIPYEQSVGYYYKDNAKYHSYTLGVHSIQNEIYKWTVDSLNKLMVVSEAREQNVKAFDTELFEDVLQTCKKYLKNGTSGLTTYRFEFSEDYGLKAYEISLLNNGQINEVILYYNGIADDSEGIENPVMKFPKLQIQFANYSNTLPRLVQDVFSNAKYFTLSNQKLQIQTAYKNYKLADQRILKK